MLQMHGMRLMTDQFGGRRRWQEHSLTLAAHISYIHTHARIHTYTRTHTHTHRWEFKDNDVAPAGGGFGGGQSENDDGGGKRDVKDVYKEKENKNNTNMDNIPSLSPVRTEKTIPTFTTPSSKKDMVSLTVSASSLPSNVIARQTGSPNRSPCWHLSKEEKSSKSKSEKGSSLGDYLRRE